MFLLKNSGRTPQIRRRDGARIESPSTHRDPPDPLDSAGRGRVLQRGSGSRPVSRVLSKAVIHLRRASPRACSDLPGSGAGHASSPVGGALPYLVLLRVGFTLPPVLPPARCALTAPFHPYPASVPAVGVPLRGFTPRKSRGLEAVCFLWHFPWARAPQALPGTLPFGARTFLRPATRSSDCPVDSRRAQCDIKAPRFNSAAGPAYRTISCCDARRSFDAPSLRRSDWRTNPT